MRRLVMVAGLVAGGVVAARALQRRYAAESLRGALAPALEELREIADLVRAGMREREGELRQALGLDEQPPGTHLDPQAVRDLLDDPARPRARRG